MTHSQSKFARNRRLSAMFAGVRRVEKRDAVMRRIVLAICISCSIQFVPSIGWAAFFRGLGDLPGGFVSSQATAISGDGYTVVGRSSSAVGSEAFIWTEANGMEGLGGLPGASGAINTSPYGVSSDGSIVVGTSLSQGIESEAFIWDRTNGMQSLGDFPGGAQQSEGRGISGDGSLVVGSGTTPDGEGFIWDSASGLQALPDLPGGAIQSRAVGISANGMVIAGWGTSMNTQEATIWGSNGLPVSLGSLPGGTGFSNSLAISADGSTVVGISGTASFGLEAFIWESAHGMRGIGDLPGGFEQSFALDVSGDGSIVVGHGHTGNGASEAFIWDEVNGMRLLSSYLADQGIDLQGFTRLQEATAISDDGLTIAGFGWNSTGQVEAFVAYVPEPSIGFAIVAGCVGISALARVPRD